MPAKGQRITECRVCGSPRSPVRPMALCEEHWHEYVRANSLRHSRSPKGRARARAYDVANAERIRARKARYYEKNGARMRAEHRARTRKKRAYVSAYNAAQYAANRGKYRARSAVLRAVARGELVRPGACSRCDRPCKPQGHHPSYERADWLKVEWLCKRCHLRHHADEDLRELRRAS